MTVGQLLTKNTFHSNTCIFGAFFKVASKQYSSQELYRSCKLDRPPQQNDPGGSSQMPNPKTQSGINTVEAHICFDRRPLVHGIIFLLVKLQPSGSISFENANVPIVGAAPRTIKRKPKTNDQKGEHSKYSQLLKPERKTETCKQG